MPTDEELMSAVVEGNLDAFEELVRRHQGGAINVAYRMLSDEHAARDAAQEAFLRVLENASDYRPTASFRTYLYTILTRICIDRHRVRRAGPLPHPEARSGGGEAPEEVIIRQERAERVRRALDRLPGRQRAALVLQHYEEMSYEEIAEAMHCSVSAVDSLLVRARRNLQELLEDLM